MHQDLQQQALADIAMIEAVLTDDTEGNRMNGIIEYFGFVSEYFQAQLQTNLTDNDRQTTAHLVECLLAAQRVTRQVWETKRTASQTP
jgi:hypothetical protein